MDLFDFIERFPGENDCLEYFITVRKKVGIVCQKCGNGKHKWLASIDQFECMQCKNRIGIKSGTVMENSKLPIKYWFIAIQLLTSTNEKYTINEIQGKLSDMEPEQVRQMLAGLHSCTNSAKNGKSFDQLLLDCVAKHNQSQEKDSGIRNKH